MSSWADMLPWFAVYDHIHYTRWASIFIADMGQLPEMAPEVHHAFLNGDFIVKESQKRFN